MAFGRKKEDKKPKRQDTGELAAVFLRELKGKKKKRTVSKASAPAKPDKKKEAKKTTGVKSPPTTTTRSRKMTLDPDELKKRMFVASAESTGRREAASQTLSTTLKKGRTNPFASTDEGSGENPAKVTLSRASGTGAESQRSSDDVPKYYIHANGQPIGPYSLKTLRQWLKAGQISGATPLCMRGWPQWINAADVKELAGTAPGEAAVSPRQRRATSQISVDEVQQDAPAKPQQLVNPHVSHEGGTVVGVPPVPDE